MFAIINMKHLQLCYLKQRSFYNMTMHLIVFVNFNLHVDLYGVYLVDETLAYNFVKLRVNYDETNYN